MSRRSRRSFLAVAVTLTACATGGPVGDVSPVVVGGYAGSVVIEGQTFGAVLSVGATRGQAAHGSYRFEGTLRIQPPVEIEGDVEGVVIDDLVRLSVAYRSLDGCDGRIDGILDVAREGAALDGPVTVDDCGPAVAGRLTLRRRDADPG